MPLRKTCTLLCWGILCIPSVQASRYRVCFSSEISPLVFSLEDLSRYEKGVLKSLLSTLGPVWPFCVFCCLFYGIILSNTWYINAYNCYYSLTNHSLY